MSGPRFAVGDAVVDTDRDDSDDRDDGGVCYVVDPNVGPANVVEVGATGTMVADFEGNAAYPAGDPVVEVVFESALDHTVPEWNETPLDQLDETLDQFAREWGVPVATYSYPESRLRPVGGDE